MPVEGRKNGSTIIVVQTGCAIDMFYSVKRESQREKGVTIENVRFDDIFDRGTPTRR